MTSRWMLLRGLTRGNGHWGDFPNLLKKSQSDIEVELMEIPGNGTWHKEKTSINAIEVIDKIKSRSRFSKSREPFHICGISLGGMVALKWAQIFPTEVLSLSVINTSLRQYSPFYRRLIPENYLRIVAALSKADPLSREQIILRMTSNRPERASIFLDQFVEFSAEHSTSHSNFIRQLILANSISIDTKIETPVKVINSQGDRLVHPSCSVDLARALKLQLHTHDTSGHDLPLDDPEWLRDILLKK